MLNKLSPFLSFLVALVVLAIIDVEFGINGLTVERKLKELVGFESTVTLTPDQAAFCEALKGRKYAYRQTFTGKFELLIPGETKEQADVMLSMRYAMPIKEELAPYMDRVKVEGCE